MIDLNDKWIAHPRRCNAYCGHSMCNAKPGRYFKKAKPPVKRGRKCPTCFVELPLTGQCDSCS